MDATAMVGAEYWASFWEWIGDKAFIIVVVALAVEYITGRWAKPHREALEDARKLQIAELSKETVRLKTEGDQARAAIADANARTAQAELTMQQMKEPRQLKEKGIKALLERMAEFKGQSIVFAAVPETNEATSLARILIGILGQYGAGMKAVYNPQIAPLLGGTARGIIAEYTTGNPLGEKAAQTLVSILSEDGIRATAQGGFMEAQLRQAEARGEDVGRAGSARAGVWVLIGDKIQ